MMEYLNHPAAIAAFRLTNSISAISSNFQENGEKKKY